MTRKSETEVEAKEPLSSRGAKGQATVEFALVLVVLIGLLYGIMEIGRLLYVNAEIDNAAREASHYAALHPGVDSTYLKRNIIAPKMALVDVNSPDLVVSEPCFLKAANCSSNAGVGPFYPVKVTVSYTWRSLVNFVPDMSTFTLKPLGPLTLTSESTSLIEGH